MKLLNNVPLGAESWFNCGGTADAVFYPTGLDDLKAFLAQGEQHQGQIIALGGLANTIIRDGGVRGCVVRMGKGFDDVDVQNDAHIFAQVGALNGTVAARAVKAGIGGLEFLSGIPGTLGGALAMNAGAYGAEMSDVLVEAYALDFQGQSYVFTPDELNMSYRHTDLPAYMMFTGALLKGKSEDYQSVKDRMQAIKKARNETQPIREKTGGSTFANPWPAELEHCGLPPDTRAWQVVDMVGGRGLRIGGAQMSEKHCNFMINTGAATAGDLEALGEEIRTRAYEEFGLKLRWEIKRIGEAL